MGPSSQLILFFIWPSLKEEALLIFTQCLTPLPFRATPVESFEVLLLFIVENLMLEKKKWRKKEAVHEVLKPVSRWEEEFQDT